MTVDFGEFDPSWLALQRRIELTFKYLEKTLSGVIKNESQINLIMEHIKQKRSFKIVPEIKRFSNN